MTGAVATAAAVCEEQAPPRRERRPCSRPGGVTIGQLLARAHEAAQGEAPASCPVCGDALERRSLEAACTGCGSRLS